MASSRLRQARGRQQVYEQERGHDGDVIICQRLNRHDAGCPAMVRCSPVRRQLAEERPKSKAMKPIIAAGSTIIRPRNSSEWTHRVSPLSVGDRSSHATIL